MSQSKLHRHQELAIQQIKEWIPRSRRRTNKNSYIEMPTGSGKTYTTVRALEDIVASGKRILWIAHSNYLLEQAMTAFLNAYGSKIANEVGYLRGQQKDYGELITFAMIQTLVLNDCYELENYFEHGLPYIVIFDEFHRSAAPTWNNVIETLMQENVPVLGLSATPTRTDLQKKDLLRENFPNCAFRIGITELIHDKILAKPKLLRIEVDAPQLEWEEKEINQFLKFHEVPVRIKPIRTTN